MYLWGTLDNVIRGEVVGIQVRGVCFWSILTFLYLKVELYGSVYYGNGKWCGLLQVNKHHDDGRLSVIDDK